MRFAHPEDLERSPKLLEAHFGGETDFYECEARMRHKNGEWVWVLDRGRVAVWSGDGRPILMSGTHQDITERKRAQEEMEDRARTLRTIIEHSNEVFYIHDVEHRFQYVSPTSEAILGYSPEELQREWTDLLTDNPQNEKGVAATEEAIRSGNRQAPYLLEAKRKDGARIWLEIEESPVKDGDGRVVAVAGAARDVTERVFSERKMKRLQNHLVQSQKMESIGTLAGVIAHNFNNVLMGIQGRTSLMLMDKDPSHPDYDHLKGIEEYIGSATELTRDLLGFARGGKYEVAPTDLNEHLRHENTMFGRTKKEIRIHGKFAEGLWPVEVDKGQIRQAFLNLHVNAWQAMPDGGDLFVQTENVLLSESQARSMGAIPGPYVKISVTDTGIGMDDVTQRRIFDPFFSTKEPGVGSGLGLASVYGIIKNHGGASTSPAEKGRGRPSRSTCPHRTRPPRRRSRGPGGEEVRLGQGTILLVDDEEMIVDVGRMMLEKMGYRVLTARSGVEALDLYAGSEEEIDLVILDLIMPGMSGRETFDRLRTVDPAVRVLLASGYSINGQAKEIMARGCRGFIQKPFAMEALSRKVAEALE